MTLNVLKIQIIFVAAIACFATSSGAATTPRNVTVTCHEQGAPTGTSAFFQFQISEKPSLIGHFPGSVSSFTTKITRGLETVLDLASLQGENGRADIFITDDVEIGMNTDIGSIVLVSFNQNLKDGKSPAAFKAFLRGRLTGDRDQIPMSCKLSYK